MGVITDVTPKLRGFFRTLEGVNGLFVPELPSQEPERVWFDCFLNDREFLRQ